MMNSRARVTATGVCGAISAMPVELVSVTGSYRTSCVQLPTEQDGSLALKTLQDNFPGCCGLTFIHPKTDTTRGLRLKDGRLYPPSEGWGCFKYLCNFPKENAVENSITKMMQKDATDLIVLGLPWKTTEQTVREYFECFGKVRKVWLKRDAKGQSKGFAFIRFANYYTQMKVLTKKHVIDGRRCDVLIPHSKKGLPFKVFVGGCTEDISADDLRDYFYKYGEVTDVFVPKPFRPFSFVTFLDPEMAQSVCEENHVIKGVSVNVSIASPRHHQSRNNHVDQGFVPNVIVENPCKDSGFDAMQNDQFNVDMLNFQGLTIGSQEYVDRSQNANVSYSKFAPVDQSLNAHFNRGAWDSFGGAQSGVDQNNFSLNNQSGLSNNSYGGGNFFSWLHPGGYQGPSSQWSQVQITANQQGHPS